jgi:hypothetical protein
MTLSFRTYQPKSALPLVKSVSTVSLPGESSALVGGAKIVIIIDIVMDRHRVGHIPPS